MAYPNNKRGALLALAVSGGLWAWQNRDKISAWINTQKGQLESAAGQSSTPTPGSYTGQTRRMSEPDAFTPGDGPSTQI